MSPDISVLLPIYNGIANYPPDLLETALRSTLDQPGVSLEVCAVDNGSSDGTPGLLAGLAECYPALKVTTLQANRGAAGGMQAAADRATGRYCLFQSARSWYERGALASMAALLDSRPDVGFVYGRTQYHGERTDRYTPPPFIPARFWRNFDSLFGYLYRREAHDAGCRYVSYLEREGKTLDLFDWDFVMQLIVTMGWTGYALRDAVTLHYLYTPSAGQMTNYVHKYDAELKQAFYARWGARTV